MNFGKWWRGWRFPKVTTNRASLTNGEYTMATKVAPIFGPPIGTVQWLRDCIERGKRGVIFQEVTLSPPLAQILLGANPDNRNLRSSKLQQYAQDMRDGRWVMNGEPIIISKEGLLNDGQHRCHAIVQANRSVPVLIIFGIDRDTRTTVDQGASRGAGDYLSMEGEPHSTVLAAAGRMLVAYERNDGLNISGSQYVSNGDIMQRVRGDDRLARAAAFADTHFKHARQYVPPSVVAFCHYVLSAVHAADAETYMRQVCDGENLKRRKEVWGALQASGNTVSTKRGFAAETAARTGRTKQSINEHIARADALGDDIREVVGTSLDKGVELEALAKMSPAERAPLIEAAKAGNVVSARPVKIAADPRNDLEAVEAQVAALMSAWNRAGPEAREQFMERIDTPVFERTRVGRAA